MQFLGIIRKTDNTLLQIEMLHLKTVNHPLVFYYIFMYTPAHLV